MKRLKSGKAVTDIAAEYLKAVIDTEGGHWIVDLMQLCWETKSMPQAWHVARFVLIFYKGSPAECDNYRPISLLSILSKVYAMILLSRLKHAGAEQRLWSRQFGFRSKRSTEDALFIVRRRLEQAWASRAGRTFVLALDWRKAFDCISGQALMLALQRFGISQPMMEAIADIYTDRSFCVSDEGHMSTARPQKAGISQGCPLSPFLFGILMTVLMTDAQARLSSAAREALDKGNLEDVLFADDTLVIGSVGTHVEQYMEAIEACGREYGLQIHWGKVQLLTVCTDQFLKSPTGQALNRSTSMVYLGSAIDSDGKYTAELSRRIGAATCDFNTLTAVWKNASLSAARKVEVFNAVIVSKLRYCTASAWLSKGCLRRLDGFHCRCLRKILGIKASFISRVSNDQVRTLAKTKHLSVEIRRSQLKLFGQVLRDPAKSILKDVAFCDGTTVPLSDAWVRRVGRPRHEWTTQLLKLTQQAAGSMANWRAAALSQKLWMELVERICI